MDEFLQKLLATAFFLLFGYQGLKSWGQKDIHAILYWVGSGIVIGLIILNWEFVEIFVEVIGNLLKGELCEQGYLTKGCS